MMASHTQLAFGMARGPLCIHHCDVSVTVSVTILHNALLHHHPSVLKKLPFLTRTFINMDHRISFKLFVRCTTQLVFILSAATGPTSGEAEDIHYLESTASDYCACL